MHHSFLDLLCCPYSKESLRLEASETNAHGVIITGTLISASGRVYPIIRSIPRFVDQEHYAKSFGYQWNRWPRVQFEAENMGRPLEGHTTRMWESITEATDISGQTIVEFGCGSGRFLDVVRRKGGRAIGIDLSNAVDAARQNLAEDPDVLVVQGDVFHPPFKDRSFDGGYSIGVFHHTPDPLRGLAAMVQTIDSEGWVACSVYPSYGFYASRSVARYRALGNRLPTRVKYRLALAYSLFSAYFLAPLFAQSASLRHLQRLTTYLQDNWLPCLSYLPDARWRVLDTFDGITPEIASVHTGEEVHSWMLRAGCKNIRTSGWGETALVGVRL